MKATKQQKQILHIVIHKSILPEWVQYATEDNSKTSCNDLTFDQANKILEMNGQKPHKAEFFAKFDKDNPRHKFLLSLCIQYGWWRSDPKYGRVANLDKLDEWLKSEKSPVKKALKKMDDKELSKVIAAIESMSLEKQGLRKTRKKVNGR